MRRVLKFTRKILELSERLPMRILLPSDNQPLTAEEFEHCCRLIDYYSLETNRIVPYCTSRGRDPLVYDRGNVWKGTFVDNILRMVLSKKYNNINRLRLIGWHFSAYRLFDLSSVIEPPASSFFHNFYHNGVEELPAELDSIIRSAIDPQSRIELLVPRLTAILENVDHRYLCSQPMRFGEVAGELEEFFVNGDSLRYWGTAAVLYRSRIFEHLERKIDERGFCRVMEIGPGYGGLAYQLKRIYGNKLQFIGVDLVESLFFSSMYLSTIFDDKYLLFKDEGAISQEYKLIFVPAFRSPEFFDILRDVDLCINTVSMNEMSATQVDYYGKSIAKTLANDGIFFEVNWMAAIAGPDRIDCKSYLALHFNERLGVEGTEVAGDGNLDIWAKALPSEIREACRDEYPGGVQYFSRL